jgi:malonyl-CoA/methylmalonyl-CoA synthetase
MSILIDEWKINSKDSLLHVLPLHHIHGILNLLNLIKVGGLVEFIKFDSNLLWGKFLTSG